MENPSIHHDLGRHDAQIESLQAQVKQLHRDMQAMNETLIEINRTLSEARGGWKTLMLVGGIAAAVGATAAKFATWFGLVPR
jgi:prefoldin subunit 5